MKRNTGILPVVRIRLRQVLKTGASGPSKLPRLCGVALTGVAVLTLLAMIGRGSFSFLTSYSTIPLVKSALAENQSLQTREQQGVVSSEKEQPKSQPAQSLLLSATDIPLLQSLEERKALLDKREQQLEIREKELQDLQQRLEEKIATLALLRQEVENLMREKESFEEKRLEHLVKIYSGMKPEEAAPLIEQLSEETAVKLLYQMKERKASQILGFVKPEIAAKLSERLALQPKKTGGAENKEKL